MKNYIFYILALIPQLIFTNYILVMVSTILIGFIGYSFIQQKHIFFKMFLFELLFFVIVLYFCHKNITYFYNVLKGFQISEIVVTMILILFNAINVAVLFYLGNFIRGIFVQYKLKL